MANKDFSLITAFKFSFAVIKNNLIFFLIQITTLVVLVIISYLLYDFAWGISFLLNFIWFLAIFMIIKLILNLHDGLAIGLESLDFAREIYFNLLIFSITLSFIPLFYFSLNLLLPSEVIKSVLFLVSLYLLFRFIFAGFFIVDLKKSVVKALKLSLALTRGVMIKLFIFLLVILALIWLSVGPLALIYYLLLTFELISSFSLIESLFFGIMIVVGSFSLFIFLSALVSIYCQLIESCSLNLDN